MSKAHRDSAPCTLADLQLTTVPKTCTDITNVLSVEVPSLMSMSDKSQQPLEFVYHSSPDCYVQLSDSYLHIKCRILKQDGSSMTEEDMVSPVNLFLHALFSEVTLYINNIQINVSSSDYAYRSYLDTMLNYGTAATNSWLQSALYYPDNGGTHSTLDAITGVPVNQGLYTRHQWGKESKTMDLYGRLHVDMFMQPRPLPPNTNIRLRLTRNSSEFVLVSNMKEKQYKVEISEAVLYLKCLKLNPQISLDHARALQSGNTLKYPLTRVEVFTYTIPDGSMSHRRVDAISGQLPQKIYLGLVSNVHFNGSFQSTPFNFQSFNALGVQIIVSGIGIPSRKFEPIWENKNNAGKQVVRCFASLFQTNNTMNTDSGLSISREWYTAGGYCLYGLPFHTIVMGSIILE